MEAKENYGVVVIGAGWYGLIAATTYLSLEPDANLLILDDGESIGGCWNSERIYPSLFAQVGHGLFEYSSYPMRKEGLTKDRYISGKTISDYLQSFAEKNDLLRRTRLNTTVAKAEKADKKWILTLRSSSKVSQVAAAKLIVATGVTSGAYMPDFQSDGFNKPIIHSSQIGPEMDHFTGPNVQRATVVGAGKSAFDTVFILLHSGKKVDWVIREDGSGPLAIVSPMVAGLLNTVDVMATRAFASFSPAILNTSGWWYSFIHRTAVGNFLTKLVWRNVTRIAEWEAGYHLSANAEKLRPIPKGYGVFWANSGLGLASVPNFWKVFHSGDVTVHRTGIARFADNNKVSLQNGHIIETDHVVLCTGWTHNLDLFDEETRAKYGLPSITGCSEKWQRLDAIGDKIVLEKLPFLRKNAPYTVTPRSQNRSWRLYRQLISPTMAAKGDNSVFFAGQIHTVCGPLVAEVQALWGAAFLQGRLDIPSLEVMEEEVAVWCAWTRRRYLEQGRRHAYSIYDHLAYIDILAKDLGLNTRRKSNFFSEMFMPYRPRDWRGLIREFLEAESNRLNTGNRNLEGLTNEARD